MKVWIDGAVVDGDAARISVRDHGLLYGDGIFEGLRVCGGRVFKLDAHLRRLSYGARALGLAIPGGVTHVREVVEATVAAYGSAEAYVRLIVTRGEGPLGVDPTTCPEPRLLCMVDRLSLYPEDKRARGLAMITSSLRRPRADMLDTRIKSLNYLNNVLAKGEARRHGVDDALMLNHDGHVAEASGANVFVVRDGCVMTPPTTDGALDGITRETVLELAESCGIPREVRSLGRVDLFGADEVFLTGTGAGGLVRVNELDGQPVGHPGERLITRRLSDALDQLRNER
jgi:branched-chain amino acid aminotransferase